MLKLHKLSGVQMDIQWQTSLSCEYAVIQMCSPGTAEVIMFLFVFSWVYLCASCYGTFHKTLLVLPPLSLS